MRIKSFVDEDFIQYFKPSMFIITCFCNWKCCLDGGFDKAICQNSSLSSSPIIEISNIELITRYLKNPITSSIVFGGLEPFEQFEELELFIKEFRKFSNDDIVIYTGFNKEEIINKVNILSKYKNIVIKFGRYVPNQKSKYDEVLGVTLASPNQKGERF